MIQTTGSPDPEAVSASRLTLALTGSPGPAEAPEQRLQLPTNPRLDPHPLARGRVLELDPHRHQQQPMGVQTLSKEAVVAPLPIFGIAHDRAQNMFHTEQRIQSGQSQATLGIGRGT